jgi:hypothetical protein
MQNNQTKTSKDQEKSSTEETLKFQELEVDKTYTVKGISKPINSKYGTSYKLKVSEGRSEEFVELWSTKSLAEYIKQMKNHKKFTFLVKMNSKDQKYPFIDGFSYETEYTMLD